MDIKGFIELSKISNNRKACIYGAGYIGDFWGYMLVKDLGFTIECYIDNHKEGFCNGLPIHDGEWLYSKKEELYVFVTIAGNAGREICSSLTERGIKDFFWICEGGDEWLSDLGIYIREYGDEEIKIKFRDFIDDKTYLKERFKRRMGYEPDLDDSKTFNEKINWLKLYDRQPYYSTLVDKYEVKKYVSDKIGEQYVVKLIGKWDSFEDIEFDSLPEQFVLKCTHDSGSVIVCKDKTLFDAEAAKEIFNKRLKMNYYWPDREWAYHNVKGRIIAEEYINDGNDKLIPYKVFNFMGNPKIIQVIQGDKSADESIDYYDVNWNLLELRQNFPNSKLHVQRPKKLEEMLRLSRVLSRGIPFVRTDFFIIGDDIKFSEFTFYSDSGAERFYPDKWDEELGMLIDISGI